MMNDDNTLPKPYRQSLLSRLKLFSKSKPDNVTLKEAVDAYLEDAQDGESEIISEQEKLLITNVVSLKDMDVTDVMIPRADIVAVDINTDQPSLMALLSEYQYSRFPVFQDNLDNVLGTIHIKDILATLARKEDVDIKEILRTVPMASPAMPVLDLMHMMKNKRRHMILVVDEYGGIDGLVTIGDIIEAVLGEIQDEYDLVGAASIVKLSDNEFIVDARTDLEDIEESTGCKFDDEDLEEIDTIGGYMTSLAEKLPVRGEVLKDASSGLIFEVLEADPRRLKKIKLHRVEMTSELFDV